MASVRQTGFTLLEVLIALAVTAVVGALAYGSLTAAMDSADGLRDSADRVTEVERAFTLISRDIRQFVPRSVRDEFGQHEPALAGGPVNRFPLTLTRGGWFNPNQQPRSQLQRVNYVLDGDALWRESYPVLDRAPDTEATEVLLLEGVEDFRLEFLGRIQDLQVQSDGVSVERRNWSENWVADVGQPGSVIPPPVALAVILQLEDLGEVYRLYELPTVQ